MCGLDVTSAPPTAIGLPWACDISMRLRMSRCCVSMPPVITRLAQSISAALSSSELRSMNWTCQVLGSSAATVRRPRGAVGYLTPAKSHDVL